MPREWLDWPDDLAKHVLGQVALGKIPGMPDKASAGLEQSLLETRQRPAPDGDGQSEPRPSYAAIVPTPGAAPQHFHIKWEISETMPSGSEASLSQDAARWVVWPTAV